MNGQGEAMRQRNYGVDMLRICSMLMITAMHVLWQGGMLRVEDPTTPSYAVAWGIEIACYCAVNCYAIISGYVGYENRFRLSKVLQMWLQVAFYAAGIRYVCGTLFPDTINIWEWKQGFRPIGHQFYWYYSAYFFVSLCMPALNTVIRCMRKRQSLALLAALMLMLSVMNTYNRGDMFGVSNGYSAIWLSALYLGGAYFKKYEEHDRLINGLKRYGMLVYLLSVLVMWLKMVGSWWLAGEERRLLTDTTIMFTYPLVVLCAAALFARFTRMKPGRGLQRIVAFLTPAVFAVYLIQVHPDIWVAGFVDGLTYLAGVSVGRMLAALTATVAVIYLVCTGIELIRIRLFRLLHIPQACDWIASRVDRWLNAEE